MDDKKEMRGKEKLIEYYFLDRKHVHISMKDRRFYNGIILKIRKDKNFVLFLDNKLGEVPILFDDIFTIEPLIDEK